MATCIIIIIIIVIKLAAVFSAIYRACGMKRRCMNPKKKMENMLSFKPAY